MINLNHNLVHAYRNLKKSPAYTTITIAGLTIGLTVFLLTAIYVYGELTVDQCFDDYDQIYRLYDVAEQDCYLDYDIGHLIKQNIPDVDAVTMFDRMEYPTVLKHENFGVRFNTAICTGNDFFDVFSVQVLKQLGTDPFSESKSVILTKSSAKELFGSQEPLGQVINYDNSFDVTVTAIIDDFPESSSINADFLVNAADEDLHFTSYCDGDCFSVMNCFIKKNENSSSEVLDSKINGLIASESLHNTAISTQKFRHIYLGEAMEGNNNRMGSRSFLKVISLIALIILSLAAINFFHFTLALQKSKLKEIGIKRVNGAGKFQLFNYFLFDSILVILLSSVLSVVFTYLLYNTVSVYLGGSIDINNLFNPLLLLVFSVVLILLVFVNSLFPLYATLKKDMVSILLGKRRQVNKMVKFNPFLLIQFSVSIVLLIATFVILKQLQFVGNQDLGFNKDQLLNVELPFNYQHKEALAIEVDKLAFVESYTFSNGKPGEINVQMGSGPDDELLINTIFCDEQFVETFKLDIIYGQTFGVADVNTVCIMNEAAVKAYGWTNIENKYFERHDLKFRVIGVVRDFNISSSHSKIEPVCMVYQERVGDSFSVRLSEGNKNQQVAQLKSVWQSITPDEPFTFEFYDTFFDSLYKKEQKLAKSIIWLSIIAIILTIMGILGQVMQTCIQKTKEIGIRKVNGAREMEIVQMLNRDFIKSVMLAFTVACPVGYYLMDRWLQDFAYKTSLNWWVFAASGIAALVIALLTVSFQTIRAARKNPVESLRYE